MASNKVWNLHYYLGNTGRLVSDSNNPMNRKDAIDGYNTIAGKENPWKAWVIHAHTGEIIADNR